MNLRNLALTPVVVLIVSIIIILFLGISEKLAFNPPYLLFALNLIFWTSATIAIAFISAKSFLKEGSAIVIITSCSIILFGFSVIISGWVQTFSVNKSIALSNPCILVASILQLLSSLLSFTGKEDSKTPNRKRLLSIAYTASVIFVLINTTVALLGYYPLFFAASGPTLLRQVVLGSAVFFFAIAAIVFGMQYLRSKSSSLYWYAFAIGLFSIGLFSSFETKAIGDVPTWLGRIALYVGTLYLTAALLSTKKEANGTDRASVWAESFRSSPQQLTTFFSRMFNAFTYCKILTSKDGKPVDYAYLDVNEAAVNVIGLKKSEILGKKASEIMKIDALEDWLAIVGPVALKGEPIIIDHFSKFTGRWVHVSVYSPQKGYFVSISEDITNRKKAEEAVTYQANLLSRAHEAIFGIDSQYNITYWNKGAEAIFGWSKEEVIGKNSGDLLQTKIDGSSRSEQVNRLLTAGQWQGEAHYLRKDGSYVLVEINAATLTGPNGELQGIVTAARDIADRKKAEEALKSSKLLLESVFNSMYEGVFILDKTGKVIDFNEAFWHINKFKSREETLGSINSLGMVFKAYRLDGSYVPVEEWPATKALQGQSGTNQEFIVERTDLGVRWISSNSYAPLRNETGEIVGAIQTMHDVTDHKKAEEALKQSEEESRQHAEELEKLMDIIPAAIWISRDPKCENITGNQAANMFYEAGEDENVSAGLTTGETQETARRFFRDSRELKPHELPMQEAAAKNVEIRNSELDVILPSNRKITILGNAKPLLDDVGNVRGCLGTFIDVTERKKAEEALAKQAELIDLSPDAIIVRKIEGTITFWSKGAEKLYGWTKDEAIGQDINVLLKTKFTQPIEEILEKLKLEGKWSGEIVHTCKDGDTVVVQSYWLGKLGAEDKIVELLESNADITERIRLQAKIEESSVIVEEYANQMEELANKRAEQLKDAERLAAIGATAGMVGHDIRNPLQAITGDVFLAKTDLVAIPESAEKNSIQESLSEIEKNVDYINKIVADLQDFARPLKPNTEETDLKLVIDDLLKKNDLPENIKVTVKVGPEARKVVADSTFINRIMYNLVTNAVQAMPKGGKLTIHAYKEAKDVLITVKDTGVGIPEKVKGKLFTPMFTTKSKGQGFGLAVIKRMTESLGGTVTFESEEGKGTTFIIRVPHQRAKR